ncbi:type I-C CRISPR-associated endonuclease Cas1c [Paludisphaera mucosa]|uniref:CRISPR-associated endonuclease Cas1 n=1 Tax=Paludisphaera mucosa TaxID=3030827 RepID=A0ABT6F5Q3_9BACT|nr:type I-C CRISPR-associated endonuclease Cas1c [Paludisphaera mucosa]MDG3002831.1 type I-C CRISPR-associated endonuclease Cas1c [Paludisphaera mucosa]
MSSYHNTLYVTTPGAYLAKDHENVAVRVEHQTRMSVPMHHLGGVVCFGPVSASPELMAACMERGIGFSYLDVNGRFLARVEGPASGNVLLRRRQYRLADDPEAAAALARSFVFGKVSNSRAMLVRSARERPEAPPGLLEGAARLAGRLVDLGRQPMTTDEARGHEGEAAAGYFAAFDAMIRSTDPAFRFTLRSRRPPMDPVNALLSFVYALVRHDCTSALAAVGLDPGVGYLHVDRPGRPSLALDLMEEFRPALADRLVLALINRSQVSPGGFVRDEAGGVLMDADTRRTVLIAYQERKQVALTHPITGEATTFAVVPHIQARLLARTIRGELERYQPFLVR